MILKKYDAKSIATFLCELDTHINEKTKGDIAMTIILADKNDEELMVIASDNRQAVKMLAAALDHMKSKREVPPEIVKAVGDFVDSMLKK